MDKILQLASDYGPLGLIVLASFWYIVRKDKQHREERKELTDALSQQHKEAMEAQNKNTTVLTEISVLIRNRK